jgi:alkanesulfonate monooxygenase SsuD/methylene tetrahydromethanopterin reductase-like flavin-dependent oxidoreductase (luciferase family)
MTTSNAPDVRLGLFLSGWVDPSAGKPSAHIANLLDRIPAAESAGFSSIWVGQHLLGHPWPVLDTSVYLSRVAAATSTLEIGGVYLLPLAHPVRLAEALVTMDNVSGGRFTLCAALGWRAAEFEAIGVPIKERAGRFAEALQILKLLWYSDTPVSFHGRYYHFEDVHMTARPERAGGIPVWIGASSPPAVKRAAKVADAWMGSSHTPYTTLRELAQAYDQELALQGKQAARRPLLRHCMVASTDSLARERITQAFTAYYKALGTWGIFKDVVGEEHASGDGELPPGRAIVGSPESVVSQIRQYRRLGFNEFIFQVGLPGTPEPFVRESLKLLGGEVLPRLRAPNA